MVASGQDDHQATSVEELSRKYRAVLRRYFIRRGVGEEDTDRYTRNSPVFHADKIKTPIMLIHLDLDSFPLVGYDEMYAALSILGKDATYVRYWGEGHWRQSPANMKDELDRILAFFDRHLKPEQVVEGRAGSSNPSK